MLPRLYDLVGIVDELVPQLSRFKLAGAEATQCSHLTIQILAVSLDEVLNFRENVFCVLHESSPSVEVGALHQYVFRPFFE